MNTFMTLLQRRSRFFYFFCIVFGLVSSLWNIGLLGTINATLTGEEIPFAIIPVWQVFVLLLVLSLVTNKLFQNFMVRLSNDLSYDFGISIIEKLRFAAYEDYEAMGKEKVYTALQDAQMVSSIPRTLIESFNSIIIVVSCMGYLYYASWIGGLMLTLVFALIVLFYVVRNKKIEKDFNVVRDMQNSYFRYINDLILGFKEIKMNSRRNDSLYQDYINANRSKTKDLLIENQNKYVNNNLVGTYSFYVVIGVSLFVLPMFFELEIQQVSAYIITLLYVLGPLGGLINLIPVYTNVKIAVERLEEFDHRLNSLSTIKVRHGDLSEINSEFESIVFEDVTYEYYSKKDQRTFQLGPINLEIRRGELMFIIGGNGSGKSTFVKLLTGIYKPTNGIIYLNGIPVSAKNYPYYRNQISAIFTDNYLFSENYDKIDFKNSSVSLKQYIDTMQLSEALRIDQERNVIESGLSKGQQKRLAMIYALMEKRQVCVFDEWAAEQDPVFRRYFYEVIIKDLQRDGKTVVIITHDDEFFHHTDRLIKLDYGKIVSNKVINKPELEPKI